MRTLTILLYVVMLFCSGCGVVGATAGAIGSLFSPKEKPKTQLEIRQMQTREFETTDMKTALKAMLNVLQDDGFIIEQVNPEMGFFNAAKTMDTEDSLGKFWGTFWGDSSAHWVENTVIDCTANLSQFGEMTRVRINFQIKKMNNKGGIEKVHQIEDPLFYQEFFSKVSKSIFIEEEKI